MNHLSLKKNPLRNFSELINTFSVHIEFTFKRDEHSELPFLVCLVKRNSNGIPQFESLNNLVLLQYLTNDESFIHENTSSENNRTTEKRENYENSLLSQE